MKISARTCTQPAKAPERPEPELEFYLEETEYQVYLKVRDKANNVDKCGFVLSVDKKTGYLNRCTLVNPAFGLPLDGSGRVKLSTED